MRHSRSGWSWFSRPVAGLSTLQEIFRGDGVTVHDSWCMLMRFKRHPPCASHGIQGDVLKVAMGHHREDLGDPGSCLMKSRPKWTSRDLVTGLVRGGSTCASDCAGCGMVGLKLDRCPTTFNCSWGCHPPAIFSCHLVQSQIFASSRSYFGPWYGPWNLGRGWAWQPDPPIDAWTTGNSIEWPLWGCWTQRIQGMELMLRIGKGADSLHGWDPRKGSTDMIWMSGILICYLWDIICRPLKLVQDFGWVGSIRCFSLFASRNWWTPTHTHTSCWDSSDPSHSKLCTLNGFVWELGISITSKRPV